MNLETLKLANAKLPRVGEQTQLAPGLYLVGTPIGNLEDITLRAIRVLKQVDLIACEDTRQTQKLLNHYGIETRTISYHEHNEASRAAELVERLANFERIAIVTDAGMPGVSDPGFRLVSLAVDRGVPVVPIPGPAAFVSALVASGLPAESFCFRGFLPAKIGARRRELEKIRNSSQTESFYEAPHRIREAMEDVIAVLGAERRVVVARELTKIHEEFLRGTAVEVLEEIKTRAEIKGEITLLIAPAEGEIQSRFVSVRERVEQLMRDEKLDQKDALKKAAKELGMSKSAAYREWQLSK
ncbi:MAG TPA: 16S rRNA (cytidine(1402)-2'-O)-methyltransferase [Terriglobales bacterium]|nr:16S rRNA (cytidine(1402)-2'-O)-methyltransferase [Terriglobales bacterium]